MIVEIELKMNKDLGEYGGEYGADGDIGVLKYGDFRLDLDSLIHFIHSLGT